MKPTLIYKNAPNWVDRGESAQEKMRAVLMHFFERHDAEATEWLDEQATIVYGMVAAEGTEYQIASYLRAMVREVGFPDRQPLQSRTYAVMLWHVAKVALVRDFAERVLRGEIPINEPTPEAFPSWLATRLLDADELKAYNERQAETEQKS